MSAYFQHAEELDHSLQKRPWSSGLDLSVQQKGHHELQIQNQVCEYRGIQKERKNFNLTVFLIGMFP